MRGSTIVGRQVRSYAIVGNGPKPSSRGANWMRVVVMSDVHGFSLALARVLDDVAAIGPLDGLVVAGDLVEVGPDPRGSLDLLVASGADLLVGNTDLDVVDAARHGTGGAVDHHAAAALGETGIDRLAELRFSCRFTPPGADSPDDDLLVVHANPHDVRRRLNPELSDRAVRDVLGDAKFSALAFGHHHVAYQRRLDGRLLVDVSAVGNPKDGDLRCRYGVFTWDAGASGWMAEHRYVDYPLEATIRQIEASSLPDKLGTIQRLLRASY